MANPTTIRDTITRLSRLKSFRSVDLSALLSEELNQSESFECDKVQLKHSYETVKQLISTLELMAGEERSKTSREQLYASRIDELKKRYNNMLLHIEAIGYDKHIEEPINELLL